MQPETLPDLLTYSRNVTSQNGEDGIVEEINRRLRIEAGHFVEFGAWDGKQFSNTYSLLAQGWSGVYIEGDEAKFRDLLRSRDEFPGRIEAICAYVGLTENTIDELLSRTGTPRDFVTIGISGTPHDNRPKVVLIEAIAWYCPASGRSTKKASPGAKFHSARRARKEQGLPARLSHWEPDLRARRSRRAHSSPSYASDRSAHAVQLPEALRRDGINGEGGTTGAEAVPLSF
jgi:hypothetical protein